MGRCFHRIICVDVDIEAVDRTGLLADVVNALAEIKALNARECADRP